MLFSRGASTSSLFVSRPMAFDRVVDQAHRDAVEHPVVDDLVAVEASAAAGTGGRPWRLRRDRRQARSVTLDTPAQARPSRLRWLLPSFGPFVVLSLLYSVFGTWSVGQGFGGVDDDGGFIDVEGNPTSTPPPFVDVDGHPALWVFLVLATILAAAAFWAARSSGARSRRRMAIGVAAAVVFVVAVVVFSVLQGQLVQEAMSHGDLHPPVLGNATVIVGRMTSD